MNKYKLVGNEKLDQMKNKYGSEDYKNANKYLKDTLVMAVNDDLKGILPYIDCLLYTSPSPRDGRISRMPSSA